MTIANIHTAPAPHAIALSHGYTCDLCDWGRDTPHTVEEYAIHLHREHVSPVATDANAVRGLILELRDALDFKANAINNRSEGTADLSAIEKRIAELDAVLARLNAPNG